MTDERLSLAERTDARSIAAQAQNALVETKTISEFEAVGRMEEWRHRGALKSRFLLDHGGALG